MKDLSKKQHRMLWERRCSLLPCAINTRCLKNSNLWFGSGFFVFVFLLLFKTYKVVGGKMNTFFFFQKAILGTVRKLIFKKEIKMMLHPPRWQEGGMGSESTWQSSPAQHMVQQLPTTSPGHPDHWRIKRQMPPRQRDFFFKIKQNRRLFLLVGRAVDGGGVRVGSSQSAARPAVGLEEKMSQTQSISHPPALGLPAWTKCEMKPVGRCYWGGDRHTQNQRKARLQWNEISNTVSSPLLKLWRGQRCCYLVTSEGKGTDRDTWIKEVN